MGTIVKHGTITIHPNGDVFVNDFLTTNDEGMSGLKNHGLTVARWGIDALIALIVKIEGGADVISLKPGSTFTCCCGLADCSACQREKK